MRDVSQGAVVLCVYRERNTAPLQRLLRGLPDGWSTHLWALDAISPALADRTLGCGPGDKFDLLNRLYGAAKPDPAAHILFVDDDVVFTRGSLWRFVSWSQRAGLDLSQPAHGWRSAFFHTITGRRRWCRARLTTFVEIGPIVYVGPRVRSDVLPFPSDLGMGWGLEFSWSDLVSRGYLLGIVDRTPVRHLGTIGDAYDQVAERKRLADTFAAHGVDGWEAIQKTLSCWRPWQSRPPWQADPRSPFAASPALGSLDPPPADQTDDSSARHRDGQ